VIKTPINFWTASLLPWFTTLSANDNMLTNGFHPPDRKRHVRTIKAYQFDSFDNNNNRTKQNETATPPHPYR